MDISPDGNKFGTKIQDLVQWCETAFQHYRNGYYADSLTNMRKGGEAACKLIIIFNFPEKVAENKIGQKNYKELIETIIRDYLAPRKTINWLETLQIHGNIATHDNYVIKEQANYSIVALRLLIYWIFDEMLKASLPSRLEKVMTETGREPGRVDQEKKIEDELLKVKKEKSNLEERLHSLHGKEEQEKEKTEQYRKSLENAAAKIRELEQDKQKITALESELFKTRQEADALKQKQKGAFFSSWKKINIFIRVGILSVLVILIIVSGWFIFKSVGLTDSEKKNRTVTSIHQQTDSLKILILPFIILQNNPNLEIKFEEALINRIRQKAQNMKLNLDILYKSSFHKSFLSDEDAIKEGIKVKADLVVFGELYDPSSPEDSMQVNVRYSLTRPNNRNTGETGIKSFKKLTDSSAVRIMQEIECMVDFALADRYFSRNKYSDALALLYTTIPINKYQKISLCDFRATCHQALKNYAAAVIELENYIKLDSHEGYPFSFLGSILKQKGDYEKADEYYQKALQIEPGNVVTLQGYSDLLVTVKNYAKALQLIKEAVTLDTMNATSWYYIAYIENMLKDYSAAREYYIKSLKIDSANTNAMKELAELLAFNFNEPEKAVEYLNMAIRRDSTDGRAMFQLANIYSSTSLRNSDKAELLFKKSKKFLGHENAAATNFGLGIAAYNKGNLKTAVDYFLKAYPSDSTNVELCKSIAQAYLQLYDYGNAQKYLLRTYTIDSMDYLINYNLGNYYFCSPGKYNNMGKAVFHFERVLKTYPYDTLALENLGKIYLQLKKIDKAKEIFTKLYSLNANSLIANKGFGYLAKLNDDFKKSLQYFQKAVDVYPNDWEANAQVAYSMTRTEPEKHLVKALHYAQRAAELNPQNGTNLYIYSQVLLMTNDFAKSAEYYYRAIELDPSCKDDLLEKGLKEKGF